MPSALVRVQEHLRSQYSGSGRQETLNSCTKFDDNKLLTIEASQFSVYFLYFTFTNSRNLCL